LEDFLVLALPDLPDQVVRIVLADGGHDVERQHPSGAAAELVLHEDDLDPAGVLKLLEAYRVLHVPSRAIQLVAQNEGDLLFPSVPPHPVEHLVEGQPGGAALG